MVFAVCVHDIKFTSGWEPADCSWTRPRPRSCGLAPASSWSMSTSTTSHCYRPPSRLLRVRETLELSSITGWYYRHTRSALSVWLLPAQTISPRSSSWWRCKLQEPQLRRLFPASWITAVRCSMVCQTLCCASCSPCRMPTHNWSLARDAVIISRLYYANSIDYPSESTLSSVWYAWFASRCPGRCFSTWPTTAVSHSVLSVVSWCFDLRGAANTQ